jgi:hypothetical protein
MKPPSPRELVRAHSTLRRLARSTFDLQVTDQGGSSAWEALVEGRRMLTVTTDALARTDSQRGAEYAAAREEMLDS